MSNAPGSAHDTAKFWAGTKWLMAGRLGSCRVSGGRIPFGFPAAGGILWAADDLDAGFPVGQPNFIIVCSLAFLTVFFLLGALALAMRAITILFPERQEEGSAVLAAAVASTVTLISPGARVVQIEEISCSPSPPFAGSG